MIPVIPLPMGRFAESLTSLPVCLFPAVLFSVSATKIVEDFHIISSAMEMYYADNKSAIDKDGGSEITAEKIATALEAYIKKDSSKVIGTGTQKPGQFLITVTAATSGESATSLQWWLSYLLDDGTSGVAKILANKANQENFKTGSTGATDYSSAEANKEVFYQVL